MKGKLLTLVLAAGIFNSQAQTADSVILGANYAQQAWYSMSKGTQGSAAKDEWDIAFDVVDIMSCIHVNTAAGAMLWNYPKGDKSAWSTIDTNGLSTWDARYNSDTSWALGAMGNYKDPNNPWDIDWGIYDMSTHIITGDSIYIIKLVSGDYKKLYIEKLSSGTYYFKFANLDGSSEKSEQVSKTTFTGKNLGYYSISNQKTMNREPKKADWDLEFTQYTGFIPMPYTLAGVLQNRGVRVAEAANVPNKATYNAWQSQTFQTEINTIGYDWKTYDNNNHVYTLRDSLVYFVAVPNPETNGEDVWKLYFTGFESATGKFVFNKNNVQASSVNDVEGNTDITLALYPNPSRGNNVQVVYNLHSNSPQVLLQVTDMTGRNVYTSRLENTNGLHTYALPAGTLAPGMYILSVNNGSNRIQQQLLVN